MVYGDCRRESNAVARVFGTGRKPKGLDSLVAFSDWHFRGSEPRCISFSTRQCVNISNQPKTNHRGWLVTKVGRVPHGLIVRLGCVPPWGGK